MKNWKDLTEEELYSLTDEQIEQYKKIICAENGVPIVGNKPEKPTVEYPSKNTTVYRVNGVMIDILLTSIEEVTQLVSLLKSFKTLGTLNYINGIGYYSKGTKMNYCNQPSDITISSEQMFSSEQITNVSNANKIQDHYNEELKKYNELVSKKDEITKDFYEVLNKARINIYRRIEYTRIFNDTYLPLAEGNTEIAMNFMKKTYNISEEDEKYIYNAKKNNI